MHVHIEQDKEDSLLTQDEDGWKWKYTLILM